MSELARRRPQSVADAQTVDYTKALNYLGLSPGQPAAQALILVCQRYGLDPLLGHVTLYEGKPYVHYSAYLHIGNASPHYQGAECVREWDDDTYYWATVRVHRDDRSFYAERTGKSRKIKRKKDGSTYVDEHADAKAFAQAHRRALRLAFNVAAPDPEDDGVETPAPEPVTEVVRMVEATSGVGADAPEAQAGPESPTPGPTSGAGEAGSSSTPMRANGRGDTAERPAPGHQSDPWGLAPPAPGSDQTSGGEPVDYPRQAVDAPPDQTSPPVRPGEEAPGGDPNPPHDALEDGDALADDEGEGSDVNGVPGGIAQVPKGEMRDGSATTDPAPPNDPSPVQAWASAHGHDIRLLRVYLKRNHPDEFGDMRDRLDLDDLRPPRSDKAIAYLEAAFLRDDGRAGE